MQRVGAKIKSLQAERGWSVRELGHRISLSHTAIADIENAKQNWPIAYLPRLAEVFEVDVSELIPKIGSAQEALVSETAPSTAHAESDPKAAPS